MSALLATTTSDRPSSTMDDTMAISGLNRVRAVRICGTVPSPDLFSRCDSFSHSMGVRIGRTLGRLHCSATRHRKRFATQKKGKRTRYGEGVGHLSGVHKEDDHLGQLHAPTALCQRLGGHRAPAACPSPFKHALQTHIHLLASTAQSEATSLAGKPALREQWSKLCVKTLQQRFPLCVASCVTHAGQARE